MNYTYLFSTSLVNFANNHTRNKYHISGNSENDSTQNYQNFTICQKRSMQKKRKFISAKRNPGEN